MKRTRISPNTPCREENNVRAEARTQKVAERGTTRKKQYHRGPALVLDKIGRWAIPLVTVTVNALSESD